MRGSESPPFGAPRSQGRLHAGYHPDALAASLDICMDTEATCSRHLGCLGRDNRFLASWFTATRCAEEPCGLTKATLSGPDAGHTDRPENRAVPSRPLLGSLSRQTGQQSPVRRRPSRGHRRRQGRAVRPAPWQGCSRRRGRERGAGWGICAANRTADGGTCSVRGALLS